MEMVQWNKGYNSLDAHSKTTERIGDKNMVKESLKKILPVMQAFVEGKTIQRYDLKKDDWYDVSPNANIDFCYDYRIKPEPKYRPFKNQEECWQEMLKHQPFGWLRNIFTQRLFNIDTISHTTYNIRINDFILDGDDAFNSYTFADGTPFGIKEE